MTTATDFKTLQNQLNRIFEPFARFATTASDEELVTGTWAPAVDVAETQEKIIVRAEVPGMKQDDIAIEYQNGTLTIRGRRDLDKDDPSVIWHRVERHYGNFVRTFTLPRTVDPDKITAAYQDGILDIEVPKKEEAKPKQIRIGVK